jgi:hypothetical protein
MNLLGVLFRSAAAPAKVTPSVRPHATPLAASATRIIHVHLESAELVLKSGPVTDVQTDGPMSVAPAPDGVMVTQLSVAPGPPPICHLEIPEDATVDLQLAKGGLTVRNFRGTLRARVQSGSVSVDQSEGRFRVVVPNDRVQFERIRGEIDILTSIGAITAREIHGSLQAVTTGGAMEFEHIDGPVVARSTNGAIHASDLGGTSRLSTRTGSVRVSGRCGQLTVRTQSGDVTLDCSIVAHTTLDTYKGNLNLKLGAETNANIEAKVGQGVVRAERISPLPGSSRRTLRSSLGLGQSRLRLASGLGVINVSGPPRVARTPHAEAGLG